ncbi:MAG: hypothetical protein PWP48_1625 [Clostridiales bacterium]|jgi:membrane-bound serine protease (ClpP class)|nr:hypothetical protein [Clostridiales bacterium]MDK2992392.1 hypothetical protein [Clostridiales bacterium]
MKKLLIIMVYMVILSAVISTPLSALAADDIVYVIPAKGEVTPAMAGFVSSSIEQAGEEGASAIILDIDTPGGYVQSAMDIKDAIMDSPVPVISYVNKRALSAGVLIAIAADHLVMAPASHMGAAETIPNTEKNIAAWSGELMATAEQRGKDPQVVAAMVDKDIEIPGLVEKGKLLDLTANKALEIGYAEAVLTDINDVLAEYDMNGYAVKNIEPDWRMRWAAFISSSAIAPILLGIGIVSLLIEIFTVGFGIFGTIGIISLALYFGGNMLAGYSGWEAILLFIAGIVLLLIEATAPGLGAAGIGGIIAVIASIFFASPSPTSAIISIVVAIAICAVGLPLAFKYFTKSRLFDRLILSTAERGESGFIGTTTSADYIGKTGVTVTPLRSSGTALIDGKRIDVVSEGAFIDKGARVRVIKVEGPRVVVEEIVEQ